MSKKKILKNYLYSSVFQIFSIIVPLITAPYLARALMPDAVGINSYVNSIIQVFTLIGLIGLNSYSIREIAYVRDNKKDLSKTFCELFSLRMIMFLLTAIVYLIYIYINKEYQLYFLIALLTIMGTFIDPSWMYSGLEEFKVTVTRNIVIKILNVICIFIFIKSPDDLKLYIFLTAIFTFLGNFVLLFGVKKRIGSFDFKNMNLKRHIIPSLKLFLPQIATLIYLQVDKIMLKNLTDTVSNVGFYDQAERIVKMPLALITALSGVMLPRISNEFKNKNNDVVKKYILLAFNFSLFLAIPLMLGLMAIAPTMIPWFLGKGYEQVSTVIMMLSPIVLFISLSSVTGSQYLTATNKTKVLTISYVVSATINLIINYLLIPKLGPVGAAIGTITAEVLAFLIQIFSMREMIKINQLFKTSIKYIIASIIMYITCYFIGNYFGARIISTLLQIAVGGIIYFFVLFVLKDAFFMDNTKIIVDKIKIRFNKKEKGI